MGALDRTLRYLGLGGAAEPDSLAADMAAHRGTRPEPDALGAGLVFRGELGGDGDFHISGRFEGEINDCFFLPAEDPRITGTVEAIQRELTVDGLVMRYRTHDSVDGLPPGEGVFLACSFWLVDNLALQGRRDEACALFERLLGLCNDVGLLAEEYDPRNRRHLGNFPQAFSHLALINTALNLENHGPVQKRRSRGKADTRP